MDKRLEYLERTREKQRQKYFSPEKAQKRRERAMQYQRNARQKRQGGLKKFSDKMTILHKEDAVFYEEIWNTRKHYCENCGKWLGNSFRNLRGHIITYRYAHIIPKAVYPYLRHCSKNIMLLCLECHTKFDQSPKEIVEEMKCYDSEYIESLKQLHKQLEQENNKIYK